MSTTFEKYYPIRPELTLPRVLYLAAMLHMSMEYGSCIRS